jgi:hypothetical protein
MPSIVDFPTLVKEALDVFGDLFDNEPARQHFAEYLTGLMVAEHKTVSGINREFAITTDQSCLNRWLTEAPWASRKGQLPGISALARINHAVHHRDHPGLILIVKRVHY